MHTSQRAASRNACARSIWPALVVHGDGDPRPARAAEQVAAALPRGDLALLEDCGHFPWIEQPDAFGEVLRSWLASL